MSVIVAAAGPSLDDVTRAWVRDATSYAEFAAPDGSDTHLGERCGLGHALMRTASRERAGPVTHDGQVWVSADVRVDDRPSLVAALKSAGRRFDPSLPEDAELVLHAYAVWGDRFLDRLTGDFACVLWDGRRRRLLCARDQIGAVPLHYAVLRDRLLVATSPELLLLHPEVSDRLDEGAIADFLLIGTARDFHSSAFAEIRKLPPAHALAWTSHRPAVYRYWSLPELEPLLRLRRPEGYVRRFRAALTDAVADRVPPGPLSVQLSGGMDSTAVTALAVRLRGTADGLGSDLGIHAVTGTLGGDSGDEEGELAGLVAASLRLPLEVVDESILPRTDPFARSSPPTPEPTPYQWTELPRQLAVAAAQQSRTCLTGLGGDVLLGAAPWYWLEWVARGHPLRAAIAFADGIRMFGTRPHLQLRGSLERLQRARRAARRGSPAWLNREFAERTDCAERIRELTAPGRWVVDRRSLVRNPAWQTWFTWGDPSYTRLALRFRHPFSDMRLIRFAGALPPDPWLSNKRILREATAGLLPEAVRARRKVSLVPYPRAARKQEDRRRLAEFVGSIPEAQRFLDIEALVRPILAPDPDLPDPRTLTFPLGLVTWLAHSGRLGAPGSGPPSSPKGHS